MSSKAVSELGPSTFYGCEITHFVHQYIESPEQNGRINQQQKSTAYKPQHPEKSKQKAIFDSKQVRRPSGSKEELNNWGYGPDNGPEKWTQHCQTGQRQSPINIRARDVDLAMLDALNFNNYEKAGRVVIKNTGHGVQVEGFTNWNASERPFIVGGGLDGKYLLAQFHYHWSTSHHNGSEHTMGGLHYPVEVHFVHTKEGYSANQITSEPDGLAVVGIFLNVGTDGRALATLTSGLDQVVNYGDSTQIFDYAPRVNLPGDTENFYRYEGSLTTPGCNEAVIWTVMAEPISITKTQLKILQAVEINEDPHTGFNNRPTQPLNGRRILYRSPSLKKESISPRENKQKAIFDSKQVRRPSGSKEDLNNWGYGPDNGPEKWTQHCQTGQRQSPINIRARDVDLAMLDALNFNNYEKAAIGGVARLTESGWSMVKWDLFKNHEAAVESARRGARIRPIQEISGIQIQNFFW
uniref:Carbonic anhydrase n=1 Tax=Ditylenchus dipsaci TaxID=166011 RepID=A0A915E2P8_9BILA